VSDDETREVCRLFIPHGFAEGRELPAVAQVMPQQRSISALLMRSQGSHALPPLVSLQPSTTHFYSILTQQAQVPAAAPQYIHTCTPTHTHTHTHFFSLFPFPLFLYLSRLLTRFLSHAYTQTQVRQKLSPADIVPDWNAFVTAANFGKYAFGRVNWDPKTDPALYVRIPPQLLNKDAESTNWDILEHSQNIASAGGVSPLGGGSYRESQRRHGGGEVPEGHRAPLCYALCDYRLPSFTTASMHARQLAGPVPVIDKGNWVT
jgi:hypothetical protein